MDTNTQGILPSPVVWQPKDAVEAWQLKHSLGVDGVFAAGGTLLRTQWESGVATQPSNLIDISDIEGIQGIWFLSDERSWKIGAATTLADCRNHPAVQEHFPLLVEAIRFIAAPSIRNLATLGGNLLSTVGDSLPALLVYNPIMEWNDGQQGVEELLSDWLDSAVFHPAWKERLLMNLQLPIPDQATNIKRHVAFHKVGRREVFTPSVVTIAISLLIDAEGKWQDVRIAVGGGQSIPKRLEEAELQLNGQYVDSFDTAMLYETVLQYFEPKGDVFASVDYRKVTAANLLISELWKAAKKVN